MSGEPARAEKLAQEGLQELGDEPRFALDQMFCLLRSTEVARERGDSRQAIARVQAAQRALQRAPFKSELMESQLLMDVAESYRYAGRYEEANAAFEQASAQLTALGRDDTQTAVTLLNNWGTVLVLAGHRRTVRRPIAARSRSAAPARLRMQFRRCCLSTMPVR